MDPSSNAARAVPRRTFEALFQPEGDGGARPDFMAGCLEAVLETCGVTTSTVTVTSAGPQGFAIDIAWD